jgi:hypothetical protein
MVGDVEDARNGQKHLLLARLLAAPLVALIVLGAVTVAITTLAAAPAPPSTALLLPVGLVVASAAVATLALTGLDGSGAGGVSKVAHEGGLRIEVALWRVGGLTRSMLIDALRGACSGLNATTPAARRLRRALLGGALSIPPPGSLGITAITGG